MKLAASRSVSNRRPSLRMTGFGSLRDHNIARVRSASVAAMRLRLESGRDDRNAATGKPLRDPIGPACGVRRGRPGDALRQRDNGGSFADNERRSRRGMVNYPARPAKIRPQLYRFAMSVSPLELLAHLPAAVRHDLSADASPVASRADGRSKGDRLMACSLGSASIREPLAKRRRPARARQGSRSRKP
jgi:hypothetical protein